MITVNRYEKSVLSIIITAVTLFWLSGCSGDSDKFIITQKPLPYAENELEPYISETTMKLHYGKHHAGYVEKTNKLLTKSDLKGKTAEEVIRLGGKEKEKYSSIFNNAAQAWNHEFFWESIKPKGGDVPFGDVAKMIKKTFGSYEEFKNEFIATSNQLFGSGWVWLILENGQLKITATANADNPLVYGQLPLLTVDVWEHSYYLDYQNKRSDYVKKILENLVDWDRVELRLKEKKG